MKKHKGSMVILIGVLLAVMIAVIVYFVFMKKEQEVERQGVDYYRQKQFEAHLSDCLKVIESDPECTIAYYNAACCYGQLSESKKAVEMLERAILLDLGNGDEYGIKENAQSDEDFDPIRNDPEFMLLMKKYR